MAVGKEAPIPSICTAAAATRAALSAVVAQFNAVIEATPAPTVRRRLKDAKDLDLDVLDLPITL